MKTVTIEEVQAAFELLEQHVAKQGADTGCLWTIHAAAEEVLAILSGDWVQVAPALVAGDIGDEDDLPF